MSLWPIPAADQPLTADFPPTYHGWLAWSFDSLLSGAFGSQFAPSAGVLVVGPLYLPRKSTVTNVVVRVNNAGSGLTSGQNFGGLWTNAGNLIAATADQTTAWGSTGIKTMALAGGPYTLDAGFYIPGVWANGTTRPQFSGLSSTGWASIDKRFATRKTGLTTTAPSTLDAGFDIGGCYWFALS